MKGRGLHYRDRVILVLIALCSLFLCAMVYEKFDDRINVSCSAYFTQENRSIDYNLNMNFFFNLKWDGTGMASMDGDVIYKGVYYHLRRDVLFRYEHEKDDIYQLYDAEIFKTGRDNVPDGIMRSNFYSVAADSGRFFTITRIKNAWLIGALTGPGMMCR